MTEDVDWYAQWQEHSYNFQDGTAYIDFIALGIRPASAWRRDHIRLLPGPGFGDCSHPTTLLVLQMMAPFVAENRVLDLGSGSGVLTLAAYAQGATCVHGIDIDPEAIAHAAENCQLNDFQAQCTFGLPGSYQSGASILLLNMISSEQNRALEALGQSRFETIFSSGVLREERDLYVRQASQRGWQYVSERERDGWLGFHFCKVEV